MSSSPIFFRSGLLLLLSILFLLTLAPTPSQSAVSSIDLGAEWIKVAVVNLKPGQTPISIAINEMSKRKSPVLVAFQNGNRLIGEEAAGLTARYPDRVISHVRDLVGKPFDYVKSYIESMYLPFQLVDDSRGGVGVRIEDGDVAYSAEELAAMVLGFAVELATVHSKGRVKDVVITVPAYFGQAERKGLIQAAELAGINVLSLVNEHSGAALQYGIDKDFSNGSRNVVFYDMGASSTYAALVHFSAYNAKEYGKSVSVNQFQVKDVRWDPQLGGQTMESRLVEHFADEFNKQLGTGFDVRKSPKAMAKLKKQVKRTKEILSANTMAPISVESLYDDRDFRSTITREKFEELCEDLWEKSLAPLKQVLEHSGLKVEDVYAVELIGGATRVPRLQATLQEFLGREDLDKHLDADEATVLGASLHAANLSDGIKLNRKLGMVDGSSYGYVIEFNGPDLLKDENGSKFVVGRMKKVPSKIFKPFSHNKDFEVSLAYEGDLLPPGVASPVFAQYSVSGLTDASEKYASRNLSSPIKANMQFSLSRSGVLSLDRADAVIEISEWVEVPKKNLTVENSASGSPNISAEGGPKNTSEGGPKNTSEESIDSQQTDGGSSNTSNTSVNEQSATDLGTEKKLKKRTFRVPLKIVEKAVGPGMLSKEAFLEAKARLEALDKKDAERKRTAELKNSLEGYIYATKEKLEALKELEKISSNQERQSFIEKLDEVQEWLYMDGEDASATQFQEKLDLLKAIGDPIFFRFNELTARPAACEHARRYLSELQQVLRDAEKLRKWLDEKEAEQKKISSSSKPAFTSEEVYEKILDLQDEVASINKIPKPKPKLEKPVKNDTDSSSSSEETNTTSSEDGQTSEMSDSSTPEEADSEPDVHDEL
ncbi:hypothetical protein RHMOL_Rhmol12G0016100 [Rhododendron molle]|uniref:Uncharacterized protein n=1 Tax=Rhododendron molle TaxID=49168 RepID=A0ACC0LEY0_RHOML|nr:hypothetical protein RHMOL_Rhmol12G0016100 [Rhododendron molle]